MPVELFLLFKRADFYSAIILDPKKQITYCSTVALLQRYIQLDDDDDNGRNGLTTEPEARLAAISCRFVDKLLAWHRGSITLLTRDRRRLT